MSTPAMEPNPSFPACGFLLLFSVTSFLGNHPRVSLPILGKTTRREPSWFPHRLLLLFLSSSSACSKPGSLLLPIFQGLRSWLSNL